MTMLCVHVKNVNLCSRQPVSRRTCVCGASSSSASASAHRASPICRNQEETRPVGCAADPSWEEGPAGTRAAALTLCLALNATCADVAQAEGVVQRDVEAVKKEALLQMTGIYAALFAITGAGAAYSAIKGETAGTAPSVKVKAVKGASRKSAQKKKSTNSATAQKRFGLF
ncbi:hypothetical protein NFJ02_35g87720 [Pycnococcus provasolii]